VNADALEALVREQIETLLAGLSIEVGEPDADLPALEAAVADAERELDEFALDSTLRRALGDGYGSVRDAKVADLDNAREAYENAARSTVSTSFAASELDAAGDLGAIARAVCESIVVQPGRRNLDARVSINPL
jgi:hypothetical protein